MHMPIETQVRTSPDLSGPWRYQVDDARRGEAEGFPDPSHGRDGWPQMPIPNNWYLTEVGDYFGAVWFQTTFRVPETMQGKRLTLRFEAVDYYADVWLNDAYLGRHEGYFTPFEFDVTQLVRFDGDNLLVVRDDAPRDPFFAEFIDELSVQARALGYQVLLGHAHGDAEEGLAVTELLNAQHCDGILVLGDLRDDEIALQEMLRDHPAVVALCRGSSRTAIPTINTDNRQGMKLVLEHLVGLGHRRLAFLDGGWLGDIRERRETFAALLADSGLALPEGYIQAEANNSEGGYRAMRTVLALPERPTAVIASDDLMAIGALRAAGDAGLHVPGDLSLMGFDDILVARYLSPALTTVRQPVKEMCRTALRIMLEAVNGRAVAETLVQLPPELIVRESTGPASPRPV